MAGELCFIANALQMAGTSIRALRSPIIRWTSIGAMIFAVLFCGLLASSLALHEIIHPDAHDEHHECAITVFAHGQVNLTIGEPVLPAPVFREFQTVVFFQSAILTSNDYLLLPGRAPPVLAS
jgi:hypothetical protein